MRVYAYVCMCMYVCVCMHACACVCVCACTCTCMQPILQVFIFDTFTAICSNLISLRAGGSHTLDSLPKLELCSSSVWQCHLPNPVLNLSSLGPEIDPPQNCSVWSVAVNSSCYFCYWIDLTKPSWWHMEGLVWKVEPLWLLPKPIRGKSNWGWCGSWEVFTWSNRIDMLPMQVALHPFIQHSFLPTTYIYFRHDFVFVSMAMCLEELGEFFCFVQSEK